MARILCLLTVLCLICTAAVHANEVDYKEIERQLYNSEKKSSEAIKILQKIGDAKAIKLLENLLVFKWEEKKEAEGRVSRLESRITRRKNRQARESMAKTRAKAARALGKIGSEQSIPLLMRVIREEDNSVVREYTLKGLLEFRDISLATVYESVAVDDSAPKNRILAVVGMSQYAKRINASTAKVILEDKNPMVRLSIIKFLGKAQRKELIPLIVASAHDTEDVVRRMTAYVLSEYNTKAAADILFFLARKKDKLTVLFSLESLGNNLHVSLPLYLKFAEKSYPGAALITLKSSFSMWKQAEKEIYDEIKKRIGKEEASISEFISKKSEKRKALESAFIETEKIKLILTEKGRNVHFR